MIKRAIKQTVYSVSGSPLAFNLAQKFQTRGVYIVNFHSTEKRTMENFKKILDFFEYHFEIISIDRIYDFLNRPIKKTGLVITFDDAVLNNYLYAAPILDQRQIKASFEVPFDFVDHKTMPNIKAEQERAFGLSIKLPIPALEEMGGRASMSWDQVRDLLRRGHHVGNHTMTHRRLGETLSPEIYDNEIIFSKEKLEDKIQSRVDTFCWVGGESNAYSSVAAEKIKSAGYDFGLMTCCQPVTSQTHPLQLQRCNVETVFSLSQVRFTLGGLQTRIYKKKARFVNNLTAT